MENTRSIKQEIKEEIPDENEQYDNLSVIQNVKDEAPELEDDFGNYEYATVTDVQDEQQQSDFQMHLESQAAIKLESYSSNIDFDEDDDDDEDDGDVPPHMQKECRNEIFVDGEPEIFVEDIKDSYSKENASDPLAINTNNVVCLNDSLPKKILNLTYTPLAPTSMKRHQPTAADQQRLPPTVEICEKRGRGRPPQIFTAALKPPPVKELVRKTYSLKHRLAHKTTVSNICHVCTRSFDNPIEFERHRRRCFFKCIKCNLICSEKAMLRIHHQTCQIQHRQRKPKCSNSEKAKLDLLGKKCADKTCVDSCDICCMKFNSSQELDAHRKQKHFFANSYACHLCSKKFETNFDAVCHLKRDH